MRVRWKVGSVSQKYKLSTTRRNSSMNKSSEMLPAHGWGRQEIRIVSPEDVLEISTHQCAYLRQNSPTATSWHEADVLWRMPTAASIYGCYERRDNVDKPKSSVGRVSADSVEQVPLATGESPAYLIGWSQAKNLELECLKYPNRAASGR